MSGEYGSRRDTPLQSLDDYSWKPAKVESKSTWSFFAHASGELEYAGLLRNNSYQQSLVGCHLVTVIGSMSNGSGSRRGNSDQKISEPAFFSLL
jgi:hypothetical protein